MDNIHLTDALFAKLAGWEAMKNARLLLTGRRVVSSVWEPPTLRGAVQEGSAILRAGLVIKSSSDAENLCPCRESRQRGLICAHSVAVGLHYVQSLLPQIVSPAKKSEQRPVSGRALKKIRRTSVGETGESLELFFIMPPNLGEVLARGKIMLYIEGEWKNGRSPLNALPLDVPFALGAQNVVLLNTLELINEGETPAMLMLNSGQFSELLPKLVGHPHVTLGRKDALKILAEPLRLRINAKLESTGEIDLRLEENKPVGVIRGTQSWVLQGHSLRPLGLPSGLEELLGGAVRISRARVPQFLNLDWPRLVSNGGVQADFTLDDFVLEIAMPKFALDLAGGLAILQAKLACAYGAKQVTVGSATPDDTFWLADPNSPTRYQTRNLEAEQGSHARLIKCGFIGPDVVGLYHLKGQNLVLNFFAREFGRLEKEWRVTLEERLERSTQNNLERIEPRFEITASGEQWFDLDVAYDTQGGDRFAASDIQQLLLSGQSHTRLKSGKFALLDTGAVEELQEVLLDCVPEQNANGYRLKNSQAGFLEATLRRQKDWQIKAPAAWNQRAAQQSGEIKLDPPPLAHLESVLRPYQKDGVAWLAFLRANGFGGILADEMGLGKTLQILALLDLNKRTQPVSSPTIVVCPTSLVFNWVAEASRFTPELKVLAVQGPQRREMLATLSQHDLVITSYALLRRDAEHYREIEFDTAVLDEAQHIKNRQTQNAHAVKSICARHRLVLTGTPIENSILDLWSIFDFLMPGYLGSASEFRERYELAIIRDKNVATQERLARRLRPFLLRRLKSEVARDLPAKIEQISYCELNEEQRTLYQQVLEASRREILEAVDANGLPKSRMVVLTALLRLRQVCCDLRLLKLPAPGNLEEDLPPKAAPMKSNKLELFGELLEEVIDGGHRVLVFSQFTSMLMLLGDELISQGIEFCQLDGSTKNRAAIVEKFQRDNAIPVFLISLKAGGVGLNLTGADTVIHFDPWWNPAVETQATDRAHRIGQTRVVTSYKLITRGTVEEKILNLQNRKRALAQGLLGGEDEFVSALNWDEIQDLLAG